VNREQGLIADRYLRFARSEARGVSPLYETFATEIARSRTLLDLLSELPKAKQQPNLLFASTRYAVGFPDPVEGFVDHVLSHWKAIRSVIQRRSTQTNEPARCACLLPVFAQLEGPLAIIEVGAAAGLCLLPDKYGYCYNGIDLAPAGLSAPVFPCRVSANTPIPQRHPDIIWRSGLDLNPLDVCSQDDMQWLKTLVWPEQEDRLARLQQAIEVAKTAPPQLVSGDLLSETERLAASAPKDANLVIFHSAVLAYLPLELRNEFQTLVKDIGAHWVANESPRVLTDIAVPKSKQNDGAFILSLNGRAIATTGPHGQFINWITE
jgi:hypothetical protein